MFSKKKKIETVSAPILVVVDPGKHTTKALNKKGDLVYFRTKLSDNTQEYEVRGNSYDVEFENYRYIVGEQAEEQSFDVSKTNMLHKLVTYVAISRLVENNSSINLVINCPVSIYKYKPKRDEYKNYIYNNGAFDITIDGADFHYEIEDVLVLPEDYGVVYKHPLLFKDKRVALVGLGGLNMNFMIIDNLIPEISTMFTVDHGGNELETNITNELNSLLALNISHKEAPYIIENRGIKIRGRIDRDSTQVVEGAIIDFIDTVIQEIKKNGHNPDILDIVFVGGTSEIIQSQIENTIEHALVAKEAQWAAVEGSLILGEFKYGEKTSQK